MTFLSPDVVISYDKLEKSIYFYISVNVGNLYDLLFIIFVYKILVIIKLIRMFFFILDFNGIYHRTKIKG